MAILLSFRSLLASPTATDAESMPANVEAASQLLHAPRQYWRANAAVAALMPCWNAAGAAGAEP